MKKLPHILGSLFAIAILVVLFAAPSIYSAEASKDSAKAPPAAVAPALAPSEPPPAPKLNTLESLAVERDQLKKQVDELTRALQAIQAQRNQLVGQLLDTQVQLQLANDSITALRSGAPAPEKK